MNYKLLLTLALFAAAISCIKEPGMEPYSPSEGETFTLSIESFSNKEIGTTRSAGSETSINRGYIIFFNGAGQYKGYKSVDELSITQSGAKVTFDAGDGFSTSDKIIAIFNHDQSADLPEDFSYVTSENISEYFPLSADYLSLLEEDMNSGTYSLGIPMFLNDFTDSDRAVREVYRSVARMELFIKDNLEIEHDSHSHAIGANYLEYALINDISTGSVGVGEPSTSDECFDVDSFNNIFPHKLTGYTSSPSDTSNKVYLYPFPYSSMAVNGKKLDAESFDADRFAIILRHSDTNIYTDSPTKEYRYYKLNLLDKVTSTYFDVERNHSYRVVITAVNSRGYETLKEAYDMPPSNIEYEIYDDKGGFTYSNGQYAISMDDILSYDEVLVYGSNQTTIEFNNIRYVLPDGGQMDEAAFDTNEISFKILEDSEGLIIDTSSDFTFDKNGKSILTDKGQSITVTLEGEGECSIALKVKLGNLEMGREDIVIKKVATNGGGDGSLDAHPNHIELYDGKFIEGTWQSDDIDFGARVSSIAFSDKADNGTVIYMGENATPTGYRTMDGFISGKHAVNSYPVFSPKTRKGYYSYKRASDGETRKVMIQLEQLAPFYLGHFGSEAPEGSLYHYNPIICEKIKEIIAVDYSNNVTGQVDGVQEWSKAQKTYYKGTIWGDYLGFGERYHNLVEGLKITRNIVENNSSQTDLPSAAHYCYMKNDINGNGKIDDDEPINWYLPAQNQALAMWINMNIFDTDGGHYQLNNKDGDQRNYYWTCSEVDNIYDYTWTKPANFNSHAIAFNMLEGQTDNVVKNVTSIAEQCHIRCVRGLD